jgi:hypothetical protein
VSTKARVDWVYWCACWIPAGGRGKWNGGRYLGAPYTAAATRALPCAGQVLLF